MLKVLSAVATAAAIAAAMTISFAPSGQVKAGPSREGAALNACKQQPWPYLNCVGTTFNKQVRLVSIDKSR